MSTYPTGYLSWGALPTKQPVRPCHNCKGNPAPRPPNGVCEACRNSPAWIEHVRLVKNRAQRAFYRRQKEKTK